MNSNSTGKKSKKFVFGVTIPIMAIALIVGLIVFKAYYIVDPGHRGVVVQLGAVQSKVLSEGFHFIVPFIQEVIPLEIRVQKVQSEETTSSKDLQVVNTVIAVNFRLDPNNVNKLYQEVGLYYKERIVDPAIAESLKAVTAQYTAEELISKRSEVSSKIKNILSQKLHNYYMILDEINITEFRFSDEFNEAIEQKQIAEQQALKAKLDLERIQIEAEQKLEQAKAEAEGLKLQKDQVTPELVELRKIEAQLEAIKKWDGKLPSVTGTGAIPFINVDQFVDQANE
ncbi:MAG: prohibitin family protein [Peptococcaceae bacterium]|nr:prohibitin family protein [Peptococcaceae bacterium]